MKKFDKKIALYQGIERKYFNSTVKLPLTHTKFYYEKTYLHFFEGYCLLKEGKELGENYCQQAIDVMKTLQDYETANHLTSYLDEHGFKL
ncbi:hypothetical protein CIRMBP1294_01048 [Enterococcus cecorum]|nr:hypothetical protein CIRMBP1294_01048 [Enterococcus cecorum]